MKPLGSLRFVLAALVLYGHAFRLIEDAVPVWATASGAIAAQLGVLMFFVVSGYIICYAVETHYQERPVAFLVNRALRIYPTHILCYLIALIMLISIPGTLYGWVPKISREGVKGVEMLKDLLILPGSRFLPNPPMWSVAIEIQFYLFIGLATFFKQRQIIYWLAGILASLWTIFLDGAYFFCFFALGASFFYQTKAALILRGLALAGVLKYVLILTNRQDIPNDAMAVVALLGLGVFVWLINRKQEAGRLDTYLGGLSYPLYAIHVPILAVIAQNSKGWLDFLVVCSACILGAVFLYAGVEKPVSYLRSWVRKNPLPSVRPSVEAHEALPVARVVQPPLS